MEHVRVYASRQRAGGTSRVRARVDARRACAPLPGGRSERAGTDTEHWLRDIAPGELGQRKSSEASRAFPITGSAIALRALASRRTRTAPTGDPTTAEPPEPNSAPWPRSSLTSGGCRGQGVLGERLPTYRQSLEGNSRGGTGVCRGLRGARPALSDFLVDTPVEYARFGPKRAFRLGGRNTDRIITCRSRRSADRPRKRALEAADS